MSVPAPRRDWALFLDFDGTLVEYAPHPHSVRPDPDLVPTLGRAAAALDRALAVVTGRPIRDIDHWLGGSVVHVAGLHGAERRGSDGKAVVSLPPAPELPRARARLSQAAAGLEGVVLEDKGHGLVLHYRSAPHHAHACRAAMEGLGGESLEILHGSMIVELRPRGIDKGCAVAEFMTEPPFAARRPVFVGDDTTDEDGFRAVNAMGGISILAGPERATLARHRLSGVRAVIEWLRAFPDGSGP